MKKFNLAIIIGIAIIFIIAYLDIGGFILLGEQYTSGNYPEGFWKHFFNLSIFLMLIPALSYYLLSNRDKSEALAIFLIPFISFWFGVTDILYFWLQGKSIPMHLSHLNSHLVIGNISKFLGFPSVTSTSLFISSILGIILTYFIVKWLKRI